MLQALGSSASNDGSNGPPLGGHQLGQMEQLLLLFSGPFGFLDAGIQPFVPAHRHKSQVKNVYLNRKSDWDQRSLLPLEATVEQRTLMQREDSKQCHHMSLHRDLPSGFALFGRLSVQQRGDSRPLVFSIFHHRCLEDLILDKEAD